MSNSDLEFLKRKLACANQMGIMLYASGNAEGVKRAKKEIANIEARIQYLGGEP